MFKPPPEILEADYPVFKPAHDVGEWARSVFIDPDGPLSNPDHDHLNLATILFVWSSHTFKSQGRVVAATAQTGNQRGGGPGKKEWQESLYYEWHGGALPTFVITLCAPFFIEADPTSVCSVIEHELYHCGQMRDRHGEPIYIDGMPRFTLRGHDVEEFIGVVQRYGAVHPSMIELQRALNSPPEISSARVNDVFCGCGARL